MLDNDERFNADFVAAREKFRARLIAHYNEMRDANECHCSTGSCPAFDSAGYVGSRQHECRFSNSVGIYGCPYATAEPTFQEVLREMK